MRSRIGLFTRFGETTERSMESALSRIMREEFSPYFNSSLSQSYARVWARKTSYRRSKQRLIFNSDYFSKPRIVVGPTNRGTVRRAVDQQWQTGRRIVCKLAWKCHLHIRTF